MIESVRLGLIRWNVAPLFLVAFFCYCGWIVLEKVLSPDCEATEWYLVTLSGIATGIFGLLFKMYDSLQKNRGGHE